MKPPSSAQNPSSSPTSPAHLTWSLRPSERILSPSNISREPQQERDRHMSNGIRRERIKQ
eukprot:1381612-Amorphochlora_amoeboformis.AAC.1